VRSYYCASEVAQYYSAPELAHILPYQTNNLKLFILVQHVISKEHPVSGGGGVSESRFNVRDG